MKLIDTRLDFFPLYTLDCIKRALFTFCFFKWTKNVRYDQDWLIRQNLAVDWLIRHIFGRTLTDYSLTRTPDHSNTQIRGERKWVMWEDTGVATESLSARGRLRIKWAGELEMANNKHSDRGRGRGFWGDLSGCLLYTSPSPRDRL